jgi:hypothetical protein
MGETRRSGAYAFRTIIDAHLSIIVWSIETAGCEERLRARRLGRDNCGDLPLRLENVRGALVSAQTERSIAA